MLIYKVMELYQYKDEETYSLVKLYLSKEKAQAYLEKLINSEDNEYCSFYINEVDVLE